MTTAALLRPERRTSFRCSDRVRLGSGAGRRARSGPASPRGDVRHDHVARPSVDERDRGLHRSGAMFGTIARESGLVGGRAQRLRSPGSAVGAAVPDRYGSARRARRVSGVAPANRRLQRGGGVAGVLRIGSVDKLSTIALNCENTSKLFRVELLAGENSLLEPGPQRPFSDRSRVPSNVGATARAHQRPPASGSLSLIHI